MPDPQVSEILKLVEKRVKQQQTRLEQKHSTRSKMKALVRLNEASEILGMLRTYLSYPERI